MHACMHAECTECRGSMYPVTIATHVRDSEAYAEERLQRPRSSWREVLCISN